MGRVVRSRKNSARTTLARQTMNGSIVVDGMQRLRTAGGIKTKGEQENHK